MNPTRALINAFFDERDRWFLWLPVFMVSGIALYFSLDFEPSAVWLSLTPFGLAAGLLCRRWAGLLPVLGAIFALIIGFNAAQLETLRLKTPLLETPIGPVSMIGTLIKAEAMPDGTRLTLNDLWIKGMPREERPKKIRVKTRMAYEDLPQAGARINVWGPLWPPSSPVTPGGYDFRRHAYFAQLGGAGLSYVPPREREARYPPPFFWDGFLILFEKGRRFLNLMASARLEGPAGDMTRTLLSGNQSGIDAETLKDMRISGLSHLLSISGIHVSMMALLVYIPLRFLFALFPWLALRLPIKKISAFTAILATSLYTVLVGADAPTVRSALMTGLFFFAILADRQTLSLRVVALAAMGIMLIAPSTSMGPSFQMSFAAVLAMIAAYEKRIDTALREGTLFLFPKWIHKAGRHVRDIAITSVIATLATALFTIFFFQTFNFYGVLANMLAIPLTTLWIMPCLLLTYIFAPFDLAGPFIDGAALGVGGLIKIATTVASWPHASIAFPPMPALVLGGIACGGLWLCLWRKPWRWGGVIPIILCMGYPLFTTTPSVYISAEKELWAARLDDGRMAVYGARTANFTVQQWAQRSGWPDLVFLKPNKDAVHDALTCSVSMCLFEKDGTRVAFMLAPPKRKKGKATGVVSCPKADLVVSYNEQNTCPAPLVIDSETLTRDGAHSLTFKNGRIHIDYVHKKGRTRPWSRSPDPNTSEQVPPTALEP